MVEGTGNCRDGALIKPLAGCTHRAKLPAGQNHQQVLKNTGISSRVIDEIQNIAKRHEMEKVVLFGSRARGDFQEKSDIDLAVWGDRANRFRTDVEEDTWTLLKYDVVDMNRNVSEKLIAEIRRDGVVLYEKV